MNKKYMVFSIILLVIVLGIGTSVGSSNVGLSTVTSILSHKIFHTPLGEHITGNELSIIWIFRFPRVLLALLVGASLAISGTCIQSVLRNPLASPYTLGVSSGASFGVALVIITGLYIPFLGHFTLTTIGFLSGMMTIFLVIHFTNKIDKHLSNQTIILAGMIFSLFINALLTLLIALSQEEMRQIINWQMGSLALRGWSYVYALLPFFIVGTMGSLYYAKELDALTFGEEHALSLGVDVKKVKGRLILFAALLTGSAVAVSGTIGFIGLVAPHIVRKIFGPRHAIVIPLSGIFGALFLILTDLIARTVISPAELPVGAITALIGAPFFCFVYFSKRK
jgi:iron complex transport system permease protein